METKAYRERTNDLFCLLLRALRKWPLILLCMILVGALGFVYTRYHNAKVREMEKLEAEQAGVVAALEGDASALGKPSLNDRIRENFDESKAITEADFEVYVTELQTMLQEKLIYNTTADKMRIETTKTVWRMAEIYFDVPSESVLDGALNLPGSTKRQLVAAYKGFVDKGLDYRKLADEFGTEPEYLEELLFSTANYESGSLAVTFKYDNEDRAEAIMTEVLRQIEAKRYDFVGLFGTHTLQIVNVGTKVVNDRSLRSEQTSAVTEISNLVKQLSDLKSLGREYVVLDSGLTEAEEAEKAAEGKRKSGKVYGALGAAAGFILSVLLLMIWEALRDRLQSGLELSEDFNWRILSTFPMCEGKKRGVFDRMADRWYRVTPGETDGDRYDTVARKVVQYGKGAASILLTGDVDESVLREIGSALESRLTGTEIRVSGPLHDSDEAAAFLKESDGVVCVEKRGASKRSSIAADALLVDEWARPVIGCVVL